ncbi:hypothetical protein R1flu_002755 [Riccia fluitans]|uniref:Uncharacterized protein n=1 Tax=Riccia fluitans TaxID=41844 RepID=A0ABD1Y7J5_9MARC
MTQQRSVIQILDLPDDYGEHNHPHGHGFLSPRISFSAEFVSGSSRGSHAGGEKEIMSPEGSCCSSSRISSSTSTEFEFAMATSTFHNALFEGTADELFQGGKLLPGYITPDGKKEVMFVDPALVWQVAENSPVGIARDFRSDDSFSGSLNAPNPPLDFSHGQTAARTPKPAKWRELFATLRRVKSDSGRQRVPEEMLLPPKAMQGRKKFFRHFFSHGQTSATEENVKMSTNISAIPQSRSYSSSATFPPPIRPSSASASSSSPFDSNNVVNPPQTSAGLAAVASCSSDNCLAQDASSSRGKSSASSTTVKGGKLGLLGVPVRKVEKPGASATLVRSASGRVIVRNLSSCNVSVKNSAALQEQIRASRSREMRRSPDRSIYSSNIRVTPILNVPAVCMGPVLRGSTKGGDKGRLSNFRSLLSFKREKLPTSVATPIATQ